VIKPRRVELVGHVICKADIGNSHKLLEGKPEGKTELGEDLKILKYRV
jgi:hypothetical protein